MAPIAVEYSQPFDDSPIQTEEQFARMMRTLSPDAIDTQPFGSDSGLVTADGAGMQVYVNPFFAQVGGALAYQSSQVTVPIDAADSTRRFDRVVLRRNPTANQVEVAVLKGTPGGGHPTLTYDPLGVWELYLGLVRVDAGVTNIAAGVPHSERLLLTGDGRIKCDSLFPDHQRPGQEIINQKNWVYRWYEGGQLWEQIEPQVLLDIFEHSEGSDHVNANVSSSAWRESAKDGIERLSDTFVAPSHGRIEVMVRSSIQTETASGDPQENDRGFISARLSGPGIGTYTPGPFTAGTARSSADDTDVTTWFPFNGLVPLQTYTVTFVFQSTGGVVTYGNRRVTVRRG